MQKQSILSSNSGVTLVVLLVSTTMSMVLVGLATAGLLAMRDLHETDRERTRLTQDLRGGLDLLGINVREAGENLPDTFPAVEIIDGAGAADEIIIRRNLLDEILKLCVQLDEGTATQEIYFALPGTTPGCIYNDQQNNFDAWQEYRTNAGGDVKVYIYNPGTQEGEWFSYQAENNSANAMYIQTTGHTWEHTYTVGTTAVYAVEEWHFFVGEDAYDLDELGNPNSTILQVVENEDPALLYSIAFSIEDFQISALLDDGTTVTEILPGDGWANIQSIELALTGRRQYREKDITRTYRSRYYPRNILSH